MKLRSLLASPLVRIAVALALVALLPLLFVSWQLVSLNRGAMREQVERTNVLAARTVAEQLESQLASWLSLARSLADHPAVTAASDDAMTQLLRDSLANWGPLGVDGLGIVDPGGVLVVGTRSDDSGVDFAPIPSLTWQPLEPPGSTRSATGGPAIWFGDPVFVRAPIRIATQGGGREPIGFVVLAGDRERISAPLAARELLGAPDAQLLAIDADGRHVAGAPGAGPADADPLRDLPPSLLEAALSGRVAGSGFFADPSGGEFLAAYAPAGATSLRVLSVQPRAAADATALRMQQRARRVLRLAAALVSLLLGGAYGVVVRPLRRLLDAQRRLASPAGAEGSGEGEAQPGGILGQLEESFLALEERVRASEDLGKVFLGRYQVIELIGRGGMGTVFRGWDPKLERPVALKTVRLDRGALPDSPGEHHEKVRSLLAEAILVAQLNHPNVVTVYDFEELGGSAFLAMELVDGVTLEHLHYFGALDEERVAPLGLHLARALEAAHERGVLHRDIKSPNVLLGRDGSVKVVDFGLAQLATAAREQDGLVFGTPGYVAPEVIRGDPPTPAADLFALGVVLYESAAGRLPFIGVNIPATLRETVRGKHLPLERVRDDLDPELLQLVERLIQADPLLRPNAAEARTELQSICQRLNQSWTLPDLQLLHQGEERRTTRARAQWIETTTLETSRISSLAR